MAARRVDSAAAIEPTVVMKAGFQVEPSDVSKVCVKEPLVTSSGRPEKVGTIVATPAVPMPGTAVQQWRCDAVVGDVSPLKVSETVSEWVVGSKATVPEPVPGDAFGGDSAGPD